MRGSVKRVGSSWRFVVDVGIDPRTGRRRQILRRGFRTQKEAQSALNDVLIDLQRGEFVRPTRGTLGAYLIDWLERRRTDLRPTTIYGYRKVIEGRIVPELGMVRLADLDARTLERWYQSLAVDKGLSPKTIANTAGVLSVALADAVRLRLLRHNPAKEARVPRRAHREMSAWSAAEAEAFLDAVAGDRFYAMWRLVLTTGLRRGEVCGLRWQDVDLGAAVVEIVETRVVAEREVHGPPKTAAGTRRIALDQATVSALHGWRRRQAEERLAAGSAWTDSGRVFVDELGVPPHPETVTRWWREAVQSAGARSIRLHDARHTAATLLLRAGVPVKVVTQRLGHADVAVTMRVYQHTTAQDDQAAAAAIGRALGSGDALGQNTPRTEG